MNMTPSVLLVDHNPHFLRVLDRFLAASGDGAVQVVGSVVGGRDAIAQAARLRPDVILLDLKMPDMPGLRLLPQLRTMLPDAMLIALTLMESDEYREDAWAAGADAFVAKARLESDLIPTIQRFAARAPRHWLTPEPEPRRT
jgi:two-component system nitrate/nitrite response regulator NarL